MNKATIAKLRKDREELLEALKEMGCTCKNPAPYDWPHDEKNSDCDLTIARAAIAKAEGKKA